MSANLTAVCLRKPGSLGFVGERPVRCERVDPPLQIGVGFDFRQRVGTADDFLIVRNNAVRGSRRSHPRGCQSDAAGRQQSRSPSRDLHERAAPRSDRLRRRDNLCDFRFEVSHFFVPFTLEPQEGCLTEP
jgi:hypothetical protein